MSGDEKDCVVSKEKNEIRGSKRKRQNEEEGDVSELCHNIIRGRLIGPRVWFSGLEDDKSWKKPLCVPEIDWPSFPYCGNQEQLRADFTLEDGRKFFGEALESEVLGVKNDEEATTSEDESEPNKRMEVDPFSDQIRNLELEISGLEKDITTYNNSARTAEMKATSKRKKLEEVKSKREKFFQKFDVGRKVAKAAGGNLSDTAWLGDVIGQVENFNKFKEDLAKMIAKKYPEVTLPKPADANNESSDSAHEKNDEDSASIDPEDGELGDEFSESNDGEINAGFDKVISCASTSSNDKRAPPLLLKNVAAAPARSDSDDTKDSDEESRKKKKSRKSKRRREERVREEKKSKKHDQKKKK